MKKILLMSIILSFRLSEAQAGELAWTDFNDKFKAGEIELSCRSLVCAAKWGRTDPICANFTPKAIGTNWPNLQPS